MENIEVEHRDPADILHKLCERLSAAMSEVIVEKNIARDMPLWQTFEPIALSLGVNGYGELRDNFLSLSEKLRAGILQLELRRPAVRDNWIETVDLVASVFEARNFGEVTGNVFKHCFRKISMSNLEAISERFQAHGWAEKPKQSIGEAMLAVRETITEMEAAASFPPEVLRLLRHLLSQMEAAISTWEIFGEEGFWRAYKETFATFVQLQQWIIAAPNSEAISSKLQIVMRHLVSGVSFTANAASIVGLGLPFLLPPK